MEIEDFSVQTGGKRNNSPFFPKSLRGLLIGRSNGGKTNLLLNLLLRPGWLDYEVLMIYSNSLHQTEYQLLKRGFEMGLSKEQISNLIYNQSVIDPLIAITNYKGTCDGNISAKFFENESDIPDPKTLDPKLKNLLILDDCYLGKQSAAGSYYSRGRHNNCDTLYISQNYFALPRNSVRENSNFIILFPQNSKSISHIYQDHASELNYEEFFNFCQSCWSKKFDFVTIDLTSDILYGKFRKNIQTFYIPKSLLPESVDDSSS